jgi:uracil-DNA glycosylase
VKRKIKRLLQALESSPRKRGVFNPWFQRDVKNDAFPQAPDIRRAQLVHYLESRSSARLLLIGEALGYQGGHFTGMAMTSERILLGHMVDRGISPTHVLPGLTPRRTSRPDLRPSGFSEPTATIVWTAALRSGLGPFDFVLWNAFPWHPFHPAKGMLSNRRPATREMAASPCLEIFLDLFPEATVIAVGKVSDASLKTLGVTCRTVRHPAQGGAEIFRSQLRKIARGVAGR